MIDFAKVQKSVKELKGQLVAGQIDEKTLEDRLLELIDVAEDGYYWMFGHQSEQWFRHDGQRWIPADPNKIETSPRSQNPIDPDDDLIQNSAMENVPVNATWFLISLAVLGVIGWIVYISSTA